MLLPAIIVTDYCKCKPLSDISHLAIPKGGLDLFSKQQQWWCWETLWEEESGGPGLYKALTAKALSHLCLSHALGVCEKVMVLLGQSGFWDASLTLRSWSGSDHFNGLEHGGGGFYPLPTTHKIITAWCLTRTLEPTPVETLTPSYRPPTMNGECDTPPVGLEVLPSLPALILSQHCVIPI